MGSRIAGVLVSPDIVQISTTFMPCLHNYMADNEVPWCRCSSTIKVFAKGVFNR